MYTSSSSTSFTSNGSFQSPNTNSSSQSSLIKDIGPSVCVLQLNIEGISRAKSDYLLNLLKTRKVDVVNVQETHAKDDTDLANRCCLPGYALVKAVHHAKYGIATYARVDLNNVQLIDSGMDGQVFTITIQVNDLIIVNIYKPPRVNWPQSVLPQYYHPCIYTGDFNSHHTNWRYSDVDINGNALVQWMEMCDYHLVFDAKDKGSFHSARWNRDYNPDLTFVSIDHLNQPLPTTRSVLSNFPNSQHRPIIINIGLKIPLVNSMPLPRWNFNKANWSGYCRHLEANLASRKLEPTYSNYQTFIELVIKAAKRNIPRGYRKEFIPGWNTQSEQLFQEFQRTADHNTGTMLLKSLDEQRKAKWEATVEDMDFKRSSRKAWKVLHGLTGKQHSAKTTACVKPDAIANRMVDVTRAKRNKNFTKKIKKDLRELKLNCPSNQHLSRPFTAEETLEAIKCLKNNKAAGADNIYNEFIRHMGPRAVNWLTAFFTSILQSNKLPRHFKLAKVIAIPKPGKPEHLPENYRPIALLSCTFKLLERIILTRIEPFINAATPIEQAGFRRGRNCTDQVLALTTYIEAGYQKQLKTTAVFIDLTAAYDTVWKQGLVSKLLSVVPCKEIVDLISNMLSEREIDVYLGNCKSRRRKLNNGLPQGSVMAPQLFNLYISDLPATTATKFIYADDIALVTQSKDFKATENILTADLLTLSTYFEAWRLIPSLSKTEVSCFHLNNNLACYEPIVSFNGEQLKFNSTPKYLGVTLDRSLTYKEHLYKLSQKLSTRNNILQKLCGTTWGTSADCLRTTGIALVYSAAEYCAPVWLESAHVHKIDTKLNTTMRCISGTIKSTPRHWLPVLSHIEPPHLRRKHALKREADKIKSHPELPTHDVFSYPPPSRLKSRHPSYTAAQNLTNYNTENSWKSEWLQSTKDTRAALINPASKPKGFDLPRKLWCRLNRLRTGHGRCNFFRQKWGWIDSALCDCGEEDQTMDHIVQRCPKHSYSGPWSDLMDLPSDAITWLGNLNIDL